MLVTRAAEGLDKGREDEARATRADRSPRVVNDMVCVSEVLKWVCSSKLTSCGVLVRWYGQQSAKYSMRVRSGAISHLLESKSGASSSAA